MKTFRQALQYRYYQKSNIQGNINANIAAINGALLGAAEIVTTQFAPDSYSQTVEDKKEPSSGEEQVAKDEEDTPTEDRKEKKDNEVINNMLQYFKERFEGNDRK